MPSLKNEDGNLLDRIENKHNYPEIYKKYLEIKKERNNGKQLRRNWLRISVFSAILIGLFMLGIRMNAMLIALGLGLVWGFGSRESVIENVFL